MNYEVQYHRHFNFKLDVANAILDKIFDIFTEISFLNVLETPNCKLFPVTNEGFVDFLQIIKKPVKLSLILRNSYYLKIFFGFIEA